MPIVNTLVPVVAKATPGSVLNSTAEVVIVADVAKSAAYIWGTTKYQAVPSFAIAQSRSGPSGTGQKRLLADAVLGVTV